MEETLVRTRLVPGGIYFRTHSDGVEEFATCTALRVTAGGTREGFFTRYPFKATDSVREGEDSLDAWVLVHDPVVAVDQVIDTLTALQVTVGALKPRRGRPPKQS
jgi:hypothetical protein